jgi:hypothetical protein
MSYAVKLYAYIFVANVSAFVIVARWRFRRSDSWQVSPLDWYMPTWRFSSDDGYLEGKNL